MIHVDHCGLLDWQEIVTLIMKFVDQLHANTQQEEEYDKTFIPISNALANITLLSMKFVGACIPLVFSQSLGKLFKDDRSEFHPDFIAAYKGS